MNCRFGAVVLLGTILVLSGCKAGNAATVYDDPLHQSVGNVELNISRPGSIPDKLSPREITYTEIDHDLLKGTLEGDVEVTQANNNADDEEAPPYYKTVMQDGHGAYWVVMDGETHQYTYVKESGATTCASMEMGQAVKPETVESDIIAAEQMMGQIGLEQMVLYQSTKHGNITGLYYRYADIENIRNLDNSRSDSSFLLFDFSYVAVVVEKGVVQSMYVFRPYEITQEYAPETIISPEVAANDLLNEYSRTHRGKDDIILNEMYLAWAAYGANYDTEPVQSELRPYWVFANADHPEWNMAVDAITGSALH